MIRRRKYLAVGICCDLCDGFQSRVAELLIHFYEPGCRVQKVSQNSCHDLLAARCAPVMTDIIKAKISQSPYRIDLPRNTSSRRAAIVPFFS
jgi:hypothetical protein